MKTPQQSYPELAAALGVPELYLKREDLHPYGSHKGRSIPHMVKTYFKMDGIRDFVISSSGNAALASVHAVLQHNKNNPGKEIALKIFIGKKIEPTKLKWLHSKSQSDHRITVEQVDNPKQQAFLIDKAGSAKYLRQSTDDIALEGYHQLADELVKIQNLEAVFIPTSSGTTAQALGEAFEAMGRKIQIHIVQTTACHPMAEVFLQTSPLVPPQRDPAMAVIGGSGRGVTGSIASAIVDHIAHRKEKVLESIKASGGSGWIAGDEDIQAALNLVRKKTGLVISPNSALSVAGANQAVQTGWNFSGSAACLITGQ